MAHKGSIAAAALGSLTLAGYLDAKFHIRNDIKSLLLSNNPSAGLKYVAQKFKEDRLLLYHVLEDHAANPATANNLFLIYPTDGRTWTYKQFLEDVNKAGNWLFKELGVRKGEMVALDGPNSPEYLIMSFAIDSVGAVASLVNYNLTSQSLEHCIKVRRALSSYGNNFIRTDSGC